MKELKKFIKEAWQTYYQVGECSSYVMHKTEIDVCNHIAEELHVLGYRKTLEKGMDEKELINIVWACVDERTKKCTDCCTTRAHFTAGANRILTKFKRPRALSEKEIINLFHSFEKTDGSQEDLATAIVALQDELRKGD